MSSELERRLEGLLHELPHPEAEVGERSLAASLAALRPSAAPRRGLRTAIVGFAAALVLLAIAAGSLAASGALHVTFGHKTAPTTTALSLPRGANGIAVVVNGKLDVVTRSGFRLQGLDVSAAALSPHALYVAAGIGNSLVALAPDGRHAWSRPTGGPVRAIAWAPDGLRIAYVVGRALHVIYGNGLRDTVIDRSVRAVRPSWRADSLALAYVAAGGRAVVYDLAHRSRRVVRPSTAVGAVTQLAFAPTGDELAIGGAGGFSAKACGYPIGGRSPVPGIGWSGFSLAVAGPLKGRLALYLSCGHAITRPIPLSGAVIAFGYDGRQLAIGLRSTGADRVLAGTAARLHTVAVFPPGTRLRDLQIG
jgi:hypothetical protein